MRAEIERRKISGKETARFSERVDRLFEKKNKGDFSEEKTDRSSGPADWFLVQKDAEGSVHSNIDCVRGVKKNKDGKPRKITIPKGHGTSNPIRKLWDPGGYCIDCNIGHLTVKNALCDLGADINVMSLAIAEKYGLNHFQPTNALIQMGK